MADLENQPIHENLSPNTDPKPETTYPLTGTKNQPLRLTSYERLTEEEKAARQDENLHWAVEAERSGQPRPYSGPMTPAEKSPDLVAQPPNSDQPA